jgi:hypothetical protein
VLRNYPGLWVAVKGLEVVEAAESPGLLSLRLQERQVRGATIMRAPQLDEDDLVGLG